ncbi:hypothetical protein Pint_12122 [Pistacia integerrima]|uniref:Uncharacterized protein n=1 Tax=Pistacia integerrima TaxID=434235 RepID=A0ACC0XKD0_9ROSI|nr:hypothetical protein Pint_12122 [Pistacia integerrima]
MARLRPSPNSRMGYKTISDLCSSKTSLATYLKFANMEVGLKESFRVEVQASRPLTSRVAVGLARLYKAKVSVGAKNSTTQGASRTFLVNNGSVSQPFTSST